MAETKYGKYIIREPLEKGRAPSLHICAEEGCEGAKFSVFPVEVQLLVVTEPIKFPHPAHAHDGDEIFFIFGSNPQNYYDFDAEIEIMLGEEGESYVINTPSVFSLPPGLVHGPLTFKKVNKPVFFLEVTSISKGKYVLRPENEKDK